MVLEEYTWFPDDDSSLIELIFIRAKACCKDHPSPESFTLSAATYLDNEDMFDEVFEYLQENSIQDPDLLDKYVNEAMDRMKRKKGESDGS